MTRSLIFAGATVVERGATALLLAAMAYLLGANRETDLYFVVLFVPAAFGNMILDVCFVSVLQTLSRIDLAIDRHRAAWRIIWAALAFSSICAVVLALIAPLCIAAVGPGLGSEQQVHGTLLLRWASILLIANGLGSILANILMCDGFIVVGASRPAVNAVLTVFCSLALYAAGAHSIDGFVFGGVIAPALTTVGLVAFALGSRARRAAFSFKMGGLRELGFSGAAISTAALNSIPQLQLFVERMVGSLLPPGSLTLINLARTLYTLMLFLPGATANARFTQILAIPQLEREACETELCGRLLRQSLFLSLPVVVSVVVSTSEIVALLFGRGRVDLQNLTALKSLGFCAAIGFIGCALGTPLTRIFQILRRSKELVWGQIFATALHAALAYPLAMAFGAKGVVLDWAIMLDLLYLYFFLRLAKIHLSAAFNRDTVALFAIALVSWAAGWIAKAALPEPRPDLISLAITTLVVLSTHLVLTGAGNVCSVRERLKPAAAIFKFHRDLQT